MTYELLIKPAVLNQMRALSGDHYRQVNDKIIDILLSDPQPDGHAKKRLKYYSGNVCRLRSGDYRVFYRYGEHSVRVLAVRLRRDAYDEDEEDDFAGEVADLEVEDIDDTIIRKAPQPIRPGIETQPQQRYLPVKIDAVLLERLKVPKEYHERLIACKTEDDLLDAGLTPELFDIVSDVVLDGNLEKALAQPDLVVQEQDDLIRFVEGDLLGFLLKLNAEQERVVAWAMNGKGPTLVKGGPGTGKSTIALYRVRAIINALKAEGIERPRVLFTTYTNALVHFSEQLLKRLLGPDARFVEVRTADTVVNDVYRRLKVFRDARRGRELMHELCEAMRASGVAGEDDRQQPILISAPWMTREYLMEEICSVIEAREIPSLDEYLTARRTGRLLRLTAPQRRDVWAIYERFGALLDSKRLATWERKRRHAATLLRAGAQVPKYDGVVIDEVQDLDPSLLRLLVLLCKSPNRLFITADANQSIYGGTFRWKDVDEDLNFKGRSEALRINHRSTKQIGEAAQSYLRNGAIEDAVERDYVIEDIQPFLRDVPSTDRETRLLKNFFEQSQRYLQLGQGSCAVLVPVNKTGQAIAERLSAAGIQARWMSGEDLDLESPCVKVMNLKSAKGLEFPIVALAGFVENPHYPMQMDGGKEEREERLLRERRGMFVGMTRAMRCLMVVVPSGRRSPLLEGFDPALWNAQASEVVV